MSSRTVVRLVNFSQDQLGSDGHNNGQSFPVFRRILTRSVKTDSHLKGHYSETKHSRGLTEEWSIFHRFDNLIATGNWGRSRPRTRMLLTSKEDRHGGLFRTSGARISETFGG